MRGRSVWIGMFVFLAVPSGLRAQETAAVEPPPAPALPQATDSERPPPNDDERPPAIEKEPMPRMLLYLRLTLGGEHGTTITHLPPSVDFEGPITMSGGAFSMVLDFGVAPTGAYAIYLRGMLARADGLSVSAPGISREAHEASILAEGYGLGGVYYVWPFLYAAAVVGISKLSLERELGDVLETAETDFGIWVNADLGVEVPVSIVRFGAGVRAHYGSMASGDGGDVEHSGLGGFASLTLIAP